MYRHNGVSNESPFGTIYCRHVREGIQRALNLASMMPRDASVAFQVYTQRKPYGILLNHTEMRLYLLFSD